MTVRDVLRDRPPAAEGRVEWGAGPRPDAVVLYTLEWHDVHPVVRLRYILPGRPQRTPTTDMERAIALMQDMRENDIRQAIGLESTPTTFGGVRWWFTCPLSFRQQPCGNRVGKLYLPPGARLFGCRRCHDLAYRSSQTAHKEERENAALAMALGFPPSDGAEIARRFRRERD